MKREEFSTSETFYMIRYVYQLFLKMEERYSHLKDTEEGYDFSFLNYRGTGQNILMRPNFFGVFDEADSEYPEHPVFHIETIKREHAVWAEFSLSDSEFQWYNGRYNDSLCLVVGDHPKKWDNRYITLNSSSDPNEVFDEYGEEYFFQQLTVQNIIPYELFQQEVNWYYNLVLPNLLREDIMINIPNMELFNLKTLEGFRVI